MTQTIVGQEAFRRELGRPFHRQQPLRRHPPIPHATGCHAVRGTRRTEVTWEWDRKAWHSAVRSGIPLVMLAALFLSSCPVAAAAAATISGFVRDASNGEALSYANVVLQGTRLGALTNAQGFYTIAGIPPGSYTLVFSFMGRSTERRAVEVTAEQSLTISVELSSSPIEIEGVEVRPEAIGPVIAPSTLTLRTRELRSIPSVAEADLFRAVQALPGVSTLSDFSSGLYVRGGSPDQNLILLDDVDVYNPSHLFGFFSTFNVDAVKTVDLQKSGFPARYGGRLSSLLDVHNRDGNRKEFEGVARASLISSSLTLEGPWQRGSWMAAGRHTYIEPLARAAGYELPYAFYDLHGRLNLDLGSNDRTSLSLFRGNDRLDLDAGTFDVVLDWGNDTWSTQWTHVFSQRLFSHFVLGGSRFHSDGDIAFQDFKFKTRNHIDDLCAKGALSLKPNAPHLLDFGFEAKVLDFGWRQDVGEGSSLRFDYDGTYGALYVQDSWEVDPRTSLQPGLRLDYYSDGDYSRLGPRISARRMLSEVTALRATYGRYHQYLNLVYQEGFSFADMWFPVDRTIRPGSADHYILGVDVGPYETHDVSIEVYYKDYRNLVEFSDEFGRSLFDESTELDEVFNSGTGHAYGADLYLRNRYRGWEGWVGYSWGSTERKIENYNRGEAFIPQYDRRHQITIMQTRSLGKGWTLDLNFRYGTGQPTTLATGRYTVRDVNGRAYDIVLDGKLNDARLPAFHRLDVGLSKVYRLRGWSIEPTLQVINVYNHKNVYLRSYDLTKNPAEHEDVNMFPLLPTLGVNVRF